jgi:hypothetical protein
MLGDWQLPAAAVFSAPIGPKDACDRNRVASRYVVLIAPAPA